MAQWRKIIVSGSNAELNQISASGNIVPVSNNTQTLGTATKPFGDLFLGSGGVINLNNGDVTLTHSSNALTLAGGNLVLGANTISGSHQSTGSFGRLQLSGDAVIEGNLTFGDADSDSVTFGAEIDSHLIPNIDNTYDLGESGKAWRNLFLEGDITFEDASELKTAAGALTIDGAGGVNIQENNTTIISIDDSQNLVLNNVSGKTVTIGHSTSETTIGDNLTVTGNATVAGNLDVNGTLTTIDTDNLRVKDQYIILASGSSAKDAGIIANTSGSGTGSAFFYDISSNRWALAKSGSVAGTATAATAHQFVTSVSSSAGDPSGVPSDFGNADDTQRGMMYVNTTTGDIFIYS